MQENEFEALVQEYWKVIACTRQSGRISDNIKAKEKEYWEAFPQELVEEALKIHIQKYRGYKENYTRGILRNLKKQAVQGIPVNKNQQSQFHNFKQREYDWDALERELLG